MENNEQTKKQIFVGEVVSDRMDKTIVVKTSRTFLNSVFHKVVRRNKNYKVHDELGKAKVGDIVEFVEGRPTSKTKCMYLARVIKEANSLSK